MQGHVRGYQKWYKHVSALVAYRNNTNFIVATPIKTSSMHVYAENMIFYDLIR